MFTSPSRGCRAFRVGFAEHFLAAVGWRLEQMGLYRGCQSQAFNVSEASRCEGEMLTVGKTQPGVSWGALGRKGPELEPRWL